ncbi:S-adenosyl-L-methionine-dependent methyltransferase [Cristinia sonorae]|uniref:S-adenosyl-L-methionine-dependent methyltransferase n=1 Tax=Cristinia sonorae TaxID=1940300 RepID=A0A8K0UHT9_9AGAR|nr:S-adenosyl-L-methionine-dependent methyltransferase [Cristinia sonorae]
MSLDAKIATLRAAIQLLNTSSETVIAEWLKEAQSPSPKQSDGSSVPSHELHNARRTMVGAMGVCGDLVQDPRARLMEMALGFYEPRALHVVAEAKVADILDEGEHEKGVSIEELSRKTGIKDHKLARVLRTLCSTHVFTEVSYNHFANSPTSQVLVGNEALRSFIVTMAWSVYTSSVALPTVLFDPVKSQSDSALETAFQTGHNTKAHYFEWLEQAQVQPDGTTKQRRELPAFGLAMLGGGRALGVPLYRDYPWQDLGAATVVDVGGGVGGMSMDLARIHPNLKFVIQDRPAVVEQGKTIWQRDFPEAVEGGRVTLMAHDFFAEQPVKGAEVYHMRYIIHDWPDDDCVKILSALRPALTSPNSRILLSDTVMLTTAPSSASSASSASFTTAPAPLPLNFGLANRYQHLRDLNMMTLLNGRERSPEEFGELARRAGLRVERFWECRGYVWITELRLAGEV